MKFFLHWILAYAEYNYQEAYWESVNQSERWLKFLLEFNDEDR